MLLSNPPRSTTTASETRKQSLTRSSTYPSGVVLRVIALWTMLTYNAIVAGAEQTGHAVWTTLLTYDGIVAGPCRIQDLHGRSYATYTMSSGLYCRFIRCVLSCGRHLFDYVDVRPFMLVGLTCRSCCCLLYTSPSPRDLSTSRMPSSA